MSFGKTLGFWMVTWTAAITVAHGALNLRWFESQNAVQAAKKEKYQVGFLPVTCHLTCPVTDFINKNEDGEGFFQPMRFSGWPELKEMFIGRPGEMPASFILAPMAMALREQGVPIKIVYLGHRDGSALMVHKDSAIFQMTHLRGKSIAVPGRYANQRIMIYRELKKAGMSLTDVNIVEMPPPDMPAALLLSSQPSPLSMMPLPQPGR